jgi:uncharacterized membrane protein YhaH (DUF805 family)
MNKTARILLGVFIAFMLVMVGLATKNRNNGIMPDGAIVTEYGSPAGSDMAMMNGCCPGGIKVSRQIVIVFAIGCVAVAMPTAIMIVRKRRRRTRSAST